MGEMEMRKHILIFAALIVLGGLLLPAMPVAAAHNPQDGGVVIWNDDFVLGRDQELDGDLMVLNGNATLYVGSRIRGNAVIWNGNADVDGVIEGDLVTANGDVQLGRDSHVYGDVVCSWNCSVERAQGARVAGEIVAGPSLRAIPLGPWIGRGFWFQMPTPERRPFWASGPEQVLRWIVRLVRRLVTILVVAAIGGVVALVWPDATGQVGHTALQSPGASLGVGFLTLVAATALVIALTITICLSPVAALAALALGAVGLFGWVAVGARFGERLLHALGAAEVRPLWAGSLGTLIITLISVGLSTAFCLAPLGWLLILIVGCLGLGAVVLTRFGTTPYTPEHGRATREPPGIKDQDALQSPEMDDEPLEAPSARTENERE